MRDTVESDMKRALCVATVAAGILLMVLQADALPVVQFTGMTVTADSSFDSQDFRDAVFYVENTERTLGLQVRPPNGFPAGVLRGDKVNVEGALVVDAATGEAYLQEYGFPAVVSSNNPLPRPFVMRGSALGGASRTLQGLLTPGVEIPKASGPYNKGLLVTTWGVVTHVNNFNRFFYVDDGERLLDGYGPWGVRVSYDYQETGGANPDIQPPALFDLVTVTGISSSEVWQGKIIRVLKLRTQGDITVRFSPGDYGINTIFP